MRLMDEFIRAFFVAFGSMQTILNCTYLFRNGGLDLARKQHRELPKNATDKQVKKKVQCMLLTGIIFLVTGLFSYFSRSYFRGSFLAVSVAFAVYLLFEALYYKYWRTTGAFILSLAFCLILYII